MTLISKADIPFLGLTAISAGLRALPRSFSLRWYQNAAIQFSQLWYRIDTPGLYHTRRNLAAIFGDRMSPREIEQTTRALFHCVVQSKLLDTLLTDLSLSGLQQFLNIEGLSHLDEALAKKRGVIFLGAHFGLRSYIPLMLLNRLGYQAAAVLGEEINPSQSWTYRHLAHDTRHRPRDHFDIIAPNGSPQRDMAQRLQENTVLLILGDALDRWVLELPEPHVLPAPFLGHQLRLKTGLFRLARWMKSPMVPFFIVPRGDQFTLVIEPPLPLSEDHTVNGLRADLAAYTARLEPHLLRHPEQWAHWRRRNLQRYFVREETPQRATAESNLNVLRTITSR